MAEWSEMMRADVRKLHIGGRIVFGSGQECPITGDMVSALAIEEGAGGALEPGCVLSAACTLDLINDEGQWCAGGSYLGTNDFSSATIMPELGAEAENGIIWHKLGVFQPEAVAYMESEALVRIRAQDSIAFELADAFSDGLGYPCTLQDIWNHAVAQTRYAFSGSIPNGGAVVDMAPDWNGASLRAVLGYTAAAAGCFVRIGRTGSLEICRIWNADAQAHILDAQAYMKLECDEAAYGPVDALKLQCPDDEEEQVRVYHAGSGGLYAVSVSENPLFRVNAAHLDGLAQGMLSEIAGFKGESLRFDWRGDPQVQIGDQIALEDTGGKVHHAVLTRQTLRFSSGFSASCACDVPVDNNSGVRRAITPEGGLNAAALTGAVNGALLSVGSVTASKLAAGSITAEKIAAGALDTTILNAVTAKIASLTANDIKTDRLAAALAAFTVLTAGTASFDRATVGHLVAEALNLEFGAADEVFIRNLAVEYAQMVGAAIGNLCIRASDGSYYALDVNGDGSVTAQKISLSSTEIAAGETAAGRVILETEITAAQLNAGSILATYALVNRIDAARIDVSELFAREAFIALLRTSKIMGEKSIEMLAGEVQDVQAEVDENAIHDSVLPPEKPIIAGKLWLDRSCEPAVLRRWLGADVSADTAYDAQRSGNPLVLNDVGRVVQLNKIASSFSPVQSGSGDPSPENIRPIDGISFVRIGRCGKNMIDMASIYVNTTNTTLERLENAVRIYTATTNTSLYRGARTPVMLLRAGVTYTLSATAVAGDIGKLRVGFRQQATNTFISGTSIVFSGLGRRTVTFTLKKDEYCYFAAMATWNDANDQVGDVTYADIQLETAAAASEYEPYRGSAVQLDFGQKVYSGSLNWNTGVLTIDRKLYALTGAEAYYSQVGAAYAQQDSSGVFAYRGLTDTAYGYGTSICSHFKNNGTNHVAGSAYDGRTDIYCDGNPNSTTVAHYKYFRWGTGESTVDDFKEYLSAQHAAGTPVQICYSLAEPMLLQLSPQQMFALPGLNILHAASGEITADYTASGWEIVNDTDELNRARESMEARQERMQDALETLQSYSRLDADGLHVGKSGHTGEALIKYDSINLMLDGRAAATFAKKYTQQGEYRQFVPACGGMAFAPMGD